jgi:hypothetical protein
MPSTTTQPRVDVGALAGEIRIEVSRRLSTLLSSGFQALEDSDRGLNELQKATLIEWAVDVFDGFERSVAKKIIRDLTEEGIGVWGLSSTLADLQPGESDG